MIVVVLEHPEAALPREVEEAHPSGRRERRGRRELVVWRDVDAADPLRGGESLERRDVDPVRVDRHRHEARAAGAEGLPRGPVAERLDGDGVAWRDPLQPWPRDREVRAPDPDRYEGRVAGAQ